ncbi:family 1 glycosylhydrolase [Pseudarthrobacter sp. R1]|jgi:beta-glucosidase|uniref:glycoside hydrolase family 1 protein n=1 Tax=Pseudarthrobacter sp. R1 TaxID=2944934 RepID=UPI00210BEF6E|nr:family 1 glycosylhydrolase [Pseudarthrobacter sp. R1]MCQ6272267.1 family 1 glycosylhydrolase [Pseudarthrobacter sp. R1]
MTAFKPGFLWGASTSPHQTEGNNVNSDWWGREGLYPGMELSGDANDSYHRYREDMTLLAEAGLNSYRFGIEWARIEPRPGVFSSALLKHYRAMIDTALELGIKPVITLHHFSSPRWFADEGGWSTPNAAERFARYVKAASSILGDVGHVVTINEPNMLAMMLNLEAAALRGELDEWQSPTIENQADSGYKQPPLPVPTPADGQHVIDAHHAAREVLHENTDALIGWSVANQAFTAAPGGEERLREVRWNFEDLYLEAARDDDFIGVQSYTTQQVDANGLVPHPPHPDNTMIGTAYRPDALAMAVHHAANVTKVPVLVTENGIATPDDERRIAYTHEALLALSGAVEDGVDVRGYLHWSLLDNYEWGHWDPKFGLVEVDRDTFERRPKKSLNWLGNIARSNGDGLKRPASAGNTHR